MQGGRPRVAIVLAVVLASCSGGGESCEDVSREWHAVVATLPNRCAVDAECRLAGYVGHQSCDMCITSVDECGVAVNISEYVASRAPAVAKRFKCSGATLCHCGERSVGCVGGTCVITADNSCFLPRDAAVRDASIRDGELDAAGSD